MGSELSSLSSGRIQFLREVVFKEFPQRRSDTNKATLMVCLEERVCAMRSLWTGGSEDNEELFGVEEYEELLDKAGLYYKRFREEDDFIRYFISWKEGYLDGLDSNPLDVDSESGVDDRRLGEVLGYPEESIDYFIESDDPRGDSIEFLEECYGLSEEKASCLFSQVSGFLGYIVAPSEDSWDRALSRSREAFSLYSKFMEEYIIPSLESEEDVEKALDHIQSLECSSR